ncbi:MAG: hypothetical protein KGJ78_08695 [Alphaproteobacteria bacterium]|nr:hypothetical protein [Alphaproteobacteria bacterium]
MRVISLAAALTAATVFAGASVAQDHEYYFTTTVGTFLQSCESDDSPCLSAIAPRIEQDTIRFCVPDDHAQAARDVLQWLRANQSETLGGTVLANTYLARGIRDAMGNLWGEKGTACPMP